MLLWMVAAILAVTGMPSARALAVTLADGDLVAIEANAIVKIDPLTGARTPISAGGEIGTAQAVSVDRTRAIYVADRDSACCPSARDGDLIRIDLSNGDQTLVGENVLFDATLDLEIDVDGRVVVSNEQEFPEPEFLLSAFDRDTGLRAGPMRDLGFPLTDAEETNFSISALGESP